MLGGLWELTETSPLLIVTDDAPRQHRARQLLSLLRPAAIVKGIHVVTVGFEGVDLQALDAYTDPWVCVHSHTHSLTH